MTGAEHARKVAREEAVHARERLGRLARRVKREAATCALTVARLDSAIAVAFEIEEHPA